MLAFAAPCLEKVLMTRRLSAVNRPGKSGASGNSGAVHPCVFVDARLVNGGAE